MRATAVVTLVIAASKALGFVRDIITAGYFGTGMESDAYAAAYSLFYVPILLMNSCITSTVVPLCVRERELGGRRRENGFTSSAITAFCLIAAAVALVMFFLSRQLVGAVYYRFDPDKAGLTSDLLRIMLPTMVFHIASIVLASLLNAREKYAAAQITGFPLSLCVIATTVLFSGAMGVRATAVGVAAASVCECLLLLPFLRGSYRYHPRNPMRDRRVREMLALGLPAVFSMAISELNHMIDRFLASGLDTGSIASMNYGYKLITFLLGVLLVPLTTVAFSKMSRMAADGDKRGMLRMLMRCVELICAAVLPIVAVGAVMAKDVVRLAYMRGSFDETSVVVTGGVLLFYIIGVPAFGLRDVLNRAFHSVGDTKTPFRAAAFTVALNVVGNLLLMRVMGVNGLALSTSIAGTAGMLLLFVLARRKFGRIGIRRTLLFVGKAALAACCAGGVAWLVRMSLPDGMTALSSLTRLIAATGAGGIVYAGCAVVFGLHKSLKHRG